jgi:replication factor A1
VIIDIHTNVISDVLGKIIAVSNPAVVRNTSGDLMMRRIIKLQDLRYA